jgi:hypothetical protein
VAELFASGKQIYFWTFTVVETMDSWRFPPTWHRFLLALTNYFGRIKGLRVFEWHKRHGLHAHALIDERLSVHVVRRIARRFGFGRIQVRKAELRDGGYLAKYLGKDHGRMPYGGRAWQRLGGVGVRVNQVRFESARGKWMRKRMILLRQEGLTVFKAMRAAAYEWEHAWYLPALARLGEFEPERDGFSEPTDEGTDDESRGPF